MGAEDNKINWGGVVSSVGGLLGMIGQNARARKQHERQKELMGIQMENQKQLNQQGHELQFDMWNKTNYGAQVEHLNKAGLNPGLLYGMSGGGGTTAGSQGGGSAQGGQSHAPMDIGASVQLALMDAQRKKIEAETENIKEETTTEKGKLENILGAGHGENSEATKIFREQLRGFEFENRRFSVDEIANRGTKLWEEAKLLNKENKISFETMEAVIKGIQEETVHKSLMNELEKRKITLTEEQTRQIEHKIWQDWVNVGMGAVGQLGGTIAKFLKEVVNYEEVDKEGNVTGGQTTKKKKFK